METILNSNISFAERVARVLLGVMLLSGVMLSGVLPVWFALLAVYPLFSAIIAWDPLNALLLMLSPRLGLSAQGIKPLAS
jgi:hypothetical protein